jgi:hypothetical protein
VRYILHMSNAVCPLLTQLHSTSIGIAVEAVRLCKKEKSRFKPYEFFRPRVFIAIDVL